MGNTGEGKTAAAIALLRAVPNAIIVNTQHNPYFRGLVDPKRGTIRDDEQIFRVRGGRFDYQPSDAFAKDERVADRFFEWAFRAGHRVIYIDEFNDVCPNAASWPYGLQKCIKQGRWKHLGIWGSAQEPIRVPSFCFAQAQHRYLFYLGWPPHRKFAEAWFQQSVPWELIPERSHKFLLKTPAGVFGPQPPIKSLSNTA